MEFYKYEATQNDFILTLNQTFLKEQIVKLCNVHQGIGADGLINIDNLRDITIYNQDGSIANMCGNGLRCVAHLLYELTAQTTNKVSINNRPFFLTWINPHLTQVSLTSPSFIKKNAAPYNGYFVDVFNTHFIMFVEDVEQFIFDEQLKRFSKENHCNIEIIKLIDSQNIKVRVYEYGVGETSSCGSGALACFYLLSQFKCVKNHLNVHLLGGTLEVFTANEGYFLKGPVNYLYKGEFEDEQL